MAIIVFACRMTCWHGLSLYCQLLIAVSKIFESNKSIHQLTNVGNLYNIAQFKCKVTKFSTQNETFSKILQLTGKALSLDQIKSNFVQLFILFDSQNLFF